MKIRLSAWWLGVALALVGSTITPAMADQWNKETRLEVKEPLEIPGKVLAPGTYIFKLADGLSDRNIVEVFSEDARGRQNLVTTILAIPSYRMDTPERPVIRLEERASGQPEAIHSWFYPGENTGWEFVYPKSERLEVSANQAPVEPPSSIPVFTPVLPDPSVEFSYPEPVIQAWVEEQPVIAPAEAPALVPDPPEDTQGNADRMLPETAGHSAAGLLAGVGMLGLGLATVFVGLRRTEA